MKLAIKITLAVLVMAAGLALSISGQLGILHAQSGVSGGQSGIGGGTGISQFLYCGTTVACAGTPQAGAKMVFGSAPLSSGTPSTAVITGLPFTSSTSFRCTATDGTAVSAIEITYTSGSSVTLTGGTTVTDTISYICGGT